MALVKNILMVVNEILENNDCFYHDGTPSEDSAYKWTDCKYVFATYEEIESHFSVDYNHSSIEKKIFWEIDDSGYEAKPLPEISEIISHLVFTGILTGMTQNNK